ncbi:hypothetical protein HY642_02060 [Candidatus Woesearchaeota archaeon]|nr:hypothetical protein [Candidatus Woesearchaeota archaeon]
MGITQLSPSECRIDQPGFEDVVFVQLPKKYKYLPDSLEQLAQKKATLRSAREDAAYLIHAGKADYNNNRITRTYAVYFRDSGKWRAAVDDTADPKLNLVLAKAEEACTSHGRDRVWLVCESDIAEVIRRASRDGRVLELDKSPILLSTFASEGKTPFGQHPWVSAILQDMAEPYARFMYERKERTCTLYTLKPGVLEGVCPVGMAEVRCVAFNADRPVIYASHRLQDTVRCCGIRMPGLSVVGPRIRKEYTIDPEYWLGSGK